MNANRIPLLVLLVLVLAFGGTSRLSAQIISSLSVATSTTNSSTNPAIVNLSSLGTTDWVQFGVQGTGTGTSDTNELSGGSVGGVDTIDALTESVNPANKPLSIQNGTQGIDVGYTNGTSPTNSTTTISGKAAGAYSVETGAGVSPSDLIGTTLSFTIDFNQNISSGTVTLVGDVYGVTHATLTAALSNGGTATSIMTGSTSAEQDEIFTIDLSDITAGSSLTLSQVLNADSTTTVDGGGYDDLSFGGVALDLTVPEPSTWMMVGLGGIVLLVVQLRWKGRAGPAISRFGSI